MKGHMRPSCGWWGPNEEGHKRAISRRSQHHVLLTSTTTMMASVIESNRDTNWIIGLAKKGLLRLCFPQQNQNCQKVRDLQKLQ